MNRLTITRLIVCVMALVAATAVAHADPITQNSTNNGFYNISLLAPFGQTFTAEDPLIDTVGVFATLFHAPVTTLPDTLSLRYDLYAGTGTNPTPLASRTFTGPGSFDGFADVSFSGVPLVVGVTYSLMVTAITPLVFVGAGNNNPYPGGVALFVNRPAEPLDLAFHVLPAAATPEPMTVALLGLGVLGLTTKRSWRRTAMKDL